jgi:hypothetical protein
MLIGSRKRFALEISQVEPSWELRYSPEAAAWAGLTVWADGKNLCAHVRDGEEDLRTAFFVPLAPIADWFVRSYSALAFEERAPLFHTVRRLHETVRLWGQRPPPAQIDDDSWLDAREDFWSRHFLAAGAEGAWLPNLALLREDDDVMLSWAKPSFVAAPPMTMLNPDGLAIVQWAEVSRVLSDFVDEVALAFEHKQVAAPYEWMKKAPRISSGNEDPDRALRLFCGRNADALAKILGVTTVNLAATVGHDAYRDPAASPVCQVVRDLSPWPSHDVGAEVRATVDASRTADSGTRQAWTEARVLAADASRAGDTPEEQGQLAARALRSELGLDGHPIESTPEVMRRCGVTLRPTAASAEYERMLVAAHISGAPVATVLRTMRTNTTWGQRFEEARALGHALLDTLRSGALGAASTRWAQETRRRRSGAFAAELLLPASALEAASGGRLDGAYMADAFERLMQTYGVGARTAAHQLHNHNWLSSPSLRDDLIDLHAKRA